MSTSVEITRELDTTVITWAGLDTGEAGVVYKPVRLEGRLGSIQAFGLSTSTLVLEGSNDGTNFVTLDDLSGTALSKTGDGLYNFKTAAKYIRPALSGGTDTGVAVTVVLRG